MYRKKVKTDSPQLRIESFFLPFGGKLKSDNKWVILSNLIPWDEFEDEYAQKFSESNGAPAIPFRVALGSLIIKERIGLTDRETVEQIEENPYLQYFLGYTKFLDNAPFDHSMMTHFRKRISEQMLAEINQKIVLRHLKKDAAPDDDDKSDKSPLQDTEIKADSSQEPSGTMILDATCTPADIRFPTDLSLLNEAREKSEKIIDILHKAGDHSGEKPRTYRKEARKEYLKAARKKSLTLANRRKAVRKQLGYLGRNLRTISKLGKVDLLSAKEYRELLIISELYRQQLELFKDSKRSVANRIVSISQPHIRPIVRGKAGKPTEFGAKISVSLVNGFAWLDRISYDSYNESEDLENQVEMYKIRYGYYPVRVLADQIYRSRSNIRFCKEKGIKLSGKPLGRPPKDGYSDETKEDWRQDECDRVPIEGKFGQLKRRFSLDRIMAKLSGTSKTVIGIAFLVANLERILFVPILIWLRIHFFTKLRYRVRFVGVWAC